REAQSHLLQPVLVVDVHLVTMAMALADHVLAVDLVYLGAAPQVRRIGTEPHGAAKVAVDPALLDLVALDPFGHQTDHGMVGRAEFARRGMLDAEQVAGGLDHRHLHAEADAEERHVALARELHRMDLAFGAALAEAAGHQDAM